MSVAWCVAVTRREGYAQCFAVDRFQDEHKNGISLRILLDSRLLTWHSFALNGRDLPVIKWVFPLEHARNGE